MRVHFISHGLPHLSILLATPRPKAGKGGKKKKEGQHQKKQRGGIQVEAQCEQLFAWCASLGPANQLIDYRKGEESVLKWGWSGQPPLVLL